MSEANVGSILVVEELKLIGIFTKRDLLLRVMGRGRDPERTIIGEVMTEPVRTVNETDTITSALQLMSSGKHRHLPVLSGGHINRVISMKDVTDWIIHRQQQHFDLAINAVKTVAGSNRRACC
jgi:CBS domain-containing protein